MGKLKLIKPPQKWQSGPVQRSPSNPNWPLLIGLVLLAVIGLVVALWR